MSRRPSDRQATYSPLRDKTLANVLRQLLCDEFGYENKTLFAEVMVERLLETIDAFVQPASLLHGGQLLWMAVAHDGHKHAGQPMKEIPQVPIILDLVTDEELRKLAAGEDFQVVRRQRHARLLQQALDQGGVLAQSDLAAISLRHHATIHDDLAHMHQQQKHLLPYRGSVQDIGGTLTHKVQVARLLEAGYLETEICRQLCPAHDLRSVERYAQAYKNVMKLLQHGLAPDEIASILSIGPRLMDAYLDIVNEHHPDVVTSNPHMKGWSPRPNQGVI